MSEVWTSRFAGNQWRCALTLSLLSFHPSGVVDAHGGVVRGGWKRPQLGAIDRGGVFRTRMMESPKDEPCPPYSGGTSRRSSSNQFRTTWICVAPPCDKTGSSIRNLFPSGLTS